MVAARALAGCGKHQVFDDSIAVQLAAALKNENQVSDAVTTMEMLGAKAGDLAPVLRELYATQIGVSRRSIIRALRSVDPRSEESRELFASCMMDAKNNSAARFEAIQSIAVSGHEAAKYVSLLEKLIFDTAPDGQSRRERFAAIKAVIRIQPNHKDLVNWLCEQLEGEANAELKSAARKDMMQDCIKLLGEIGPAAKSALPFIEKHAQQYSNESYRAIVSNALKQIDKR